MEKDLSQVKDLYIHELLVFLKVCFSVKPISHFSRPAKSHSFGVRLMVLNQISQSHGKSQNPEDKVTP